MPPIPTTIFPPSPLAKVWDAILARLDTDPLLKGRVKTWQTWGGDEDDFIATPITALPALRIEPSAGPFDMADECRYDGVFAIDFQLAVPRTSTAELLNFWWAVARRLRWSGDWMDEMNRTHHVYSLSATLPAASPVRIADGQGLMARGRVEFRMTLEL